MCDGVAATSGTLLEGWVGVRDALSAEATNPPPSATGNHRPRTRLRWGRSSWGRRAPLRPARGGAALNMSASLGPARNPCHAVSLLHFATPPPILPPAPA